MSQEKGKPPATKPAARNKPSRKTAKRGVGSDSAHNAANHEQRIAAALKVAQNTYQDRRARRYHFDDKSLFGEPAWDIMLNLFIGQCQEQSVTVREACIGSGAAANTALRWLEALEKNEILIFEKNFELQNSHTVKLTISSFEAMVNYFINDM